MVIRAVVFDFDGLIVDTEGPLMRAWQRIYRERGHELPVDRWLTIIGTSSAPFDPVLDLGERLGTPLHRPELDALERLYYREATARQRLLPGVQRYLDDARQLGIRVAIASSSYRKWVDDHLRRLGIDGRFDAILSRDDVTRTKPDPELYLATLQRLEVSANEALALEDSSNGLKAAKAAGLFCVVVPSELTSQMDLEAADLRLASLEELPLAELIRRPSSGRSRRPGRGHPGEPTSG